MSTTPSRPDEYEDAWKELWFCTRQGVVPALRETEIDLEKIRARHAERFGWHGDTAKEELDAIGVLLAEVDRLRALLAETPEQERFSERKMFTPRDLDAALKPLADLRVRLQQLEQEMRKSRDT